MKFTAYRCYRIAGHYETISLHPINNGVAPDKLELELPEGFEINESVDGTNTWIQHKASGAICEFAQRAPGEPPMLIWQEQARSGKLLPRRRLIKGS